MSDPNAFDNSYGTPSRKPGGFPMIWIVLIGVGIFLVMQSRGQRQNQDTPQQDGGATVEESSTGASGTTKGDWSIENVDTTDSPDRRPVPRETGTADKNDWSIEDVDTTSSDRSSPAAPKKTKKGDWSIEEVDSSNGTSVELRVGDRSKTSPSKSKQGDWEIEVD